MECIYCGKEVVSNQNRKKPKMFCSKICSVRYHSKKRYNLIKDTKEYKMYRRKYFKKWLNDNRDHFNDLCRPKSKVYQNKKYHSRKDNGLCVYCGCKIDKDRKPKVYCLKCSNMFRRTYAIKNKNNRK